MNDFRKRRFEAHLEEPVGFVKHHVLYGTQIEVHLDNNMQKTSRSCDDAGHCQLL